MHGLRPRLPGQVAFLEGVSAVWSYGSALSSQRAELVTVRHAPFFT